ncbi:MAG: outer membrane lipoprotein carrier protein LolA [Alphaproteobacteria bacterium]|nr:outer membrane lipoprotein carrier protein LolA [Alphaproteobacteria bacterium]
MKKLCSVLFALAMIFPYCAKAQTKNDIAKIENYLNSVKSLQARFVQNASNGSVSEGRIIIEKPNKIRMEYNAPANILIVGNGEYIVYNDKDLDQVSNIDYSDIPASVILGNDVKIDGQTIKVASFYKDAGTTVIGLDYKGKGDIGVITLTFSNSPFELKQWKVIDPQSVEITVSLYETQLDKPIDSPVFKFKKDSSRFKLKKGR